MYDVGLQHCLVTAGYLLGQQMHAQQLWLHGVCSTPGTDVSGCATSQKHWGTAHETLPLYSRKQASCSFDCWVAWCNGCQVAGVLLYAWLHAGVDNVIEVSWGNGMKVNGNKVTYKFGGTGCQPCELLAATADC
jgi:hypothetical protein